MRVRMDDEQRVAQRLHVLRDLGFIKFIGQRRIKEVQPLTPPSPSGKRPLPSLPTQVGR